MDQYLLDNLLYSFMCEDGLVYYREVVDDGEGYIVLFPPNEFDSKWRHLHTYRFPPDVWGIDSRE